MKRFFQFRAAFLIALAFLIIGPVMAQDSPRTAPGTPTYVVGDSIVLNWPAMYGAAREVPIINDGVGGTGSWTGTKKQFQHGPASGYRFEQEIWAYAHNDIVVYNPAGGAEIAKVKNELRSYLASVFSKTFVPANDSTRITEANGAWTTGTTSLGDKASLSGVNYGAGRIRFATVAGLTQQITISGPSVVIHCFAGTGSGGGVIGNFDVYVDGAGSPAVSYNGNGDSDGRSPGETFTSPITHAVVVLQNLGPGSHTIRVQTTQALPVYIDGYATLVTPSNAPRVKLMLPLRPLVNTIGCACYTSTDFDNMDAAIRSVRAEFPAYQIDVIDSNAGFPSTGYTNDNEHPNASIGQPFLANAAANDDGVSDDAYGTWTPTVTGVSGTYAVLANWSRHGQDVRVDVRFRSGSFTMTNATITLPPDIILGAGGTLMMVNSGNGAGVGVGLVNTDSKLYVPNFSGSDAMITGFYKTQ